jgi:adenine-specific DNA-methyltransferase
MHHKTKEMLRNALLAQLEESGGSAGNKALREAMEAALGREVSQEDYDEVKEELVAEGLLGRGKGKGGSVYLAAADDDEDADDDFSLAVQEAPEPSEAKPRKAKAAAPGGPANQPNQVLAYRHDEKRKNNPHVGMVDVASDHEESETTWAYDPHIDPALQFDPQRAGIEALIDDALASGDAAQMRAALEELKRMQSPYLNWAGKAERTSFEVDTVSLHVHERIDPATILAAVQKRIKDSKGKTVGGFQPDMFHAPFENLPLSQAIDFYKHDRDWANRLIAGDSLLVMNSLLQKEGMAGQVQMIYIDPPYGIKYGSNFQPFTNKRDVKDRKDEDLTQEPEMIKAFRDTWELGIHSYLTYLRDRLLLAKELLHESGSVFVQISDENLHHVREIMDEVLGTENFVSQISFQKTGGIESTLLSSTVDYIIWYGKNRIEVGQKFKRLYQFRSMGDTSLDRYDQIKLDAGASRRLSPKEISGGVVGTGRRYQLAPLYSDGASNSPQRFEFCGSVYEPRTDAHWKTSVEGLATLVRAGRVEKMGSVVRYCRFADDFPVIPVSDRWESMQIGVQRSYVVQTAASVLERCILMATDPGDLVLDPTCGSGTTAFVAEKWGRRWITCDTSRVAVTLAKQRLATASFDYFELKYPHEGLRGGFIYKTVPHVTLKSIANNPEIDEIYDSLHPAVESALTKLNATLKGQAISFVVSEGGRKGEEVNFAAAASKTFTLPTGDKAPVNTLLEWEVPFDFPEDWPASARKAFDAFHAARQAMQQKMDESIASHAGQEILYDQPEVSRNKLRITGPFTVEAVPFATVLALDEAEQPVEADIAVARSGETSRQSQWRDELLKAGIRGKGGQKLRLLDLEPLPGARYIHAVGTVAETNERVAVSFGPEHAALEQRQVEIAKQEAGDLFPLPKLLVFCAFTFDPEAAKDIDAVRGITALKVQMNTDLLTEDLKKGRASNESFWLMGQPEVAVKRLKNDLFQVEVKGFDYFDTKTGELKSGGKKNIALWSLDTDYDNRSVFPRQVFFPMAGGKEGWYKLKKDIRAELDESLLEKFHGTVSLPFEAGDNQCIAVKIVDDRGIESLKVIRLDQV